jgi:WD40 repeat protein
VLWRANVAANHAKGEAEGLLRDSYFEQGRMRILEGDRLGALAPLATAYRMGSTGAPTRLLLEEAARPTRARLLTLAGHTGKLFDIAYSPDGKWLATASADRTTRLWDTATGALRATVQHADRVATLAFSPDSRLLASGSQDQTVRVWDVIAGRELAALSIGAPLQRIEFSPDGSTLLTAAAQRTLRLWQMPTGTAAGELAGLGRIQGATFCRTGACIVAWDTDRIIVWDTATRAPRASYQVDGSQQLHSATVSQTGALLALGTKLGRFVLLRGDGTLIVDRAAHDEPVFDIAISPDESLVVTGSDDRTARLWSASGEPRGILAGHRASVLQVRFTPAGDRIVTTSADGTARLWLASGGLLGEVTGHTDIVSKAAIDPGGKLLATASWDRTAMVWDLERAQELRPIFIGREFSPPAVAFDPSGRRLAVAPADGTLSVVDVQTGSVACTTERATAIKRLAWTSCEELAFVRGRGQAVERLDARRCTAVSALEHPAPIAAMSTRPGPRLATAAGEVVRIWNRGGLEASFTGYPGGVLRVGVDGDDVYAITGAPAAVVVDTIGGAVQRRIFHAGTQPITDVRFDREQGRLLATSFDQFLYVWDAATGALLHKLEGSGPLYAVRTSTDGSLMIGVGGISPTIWDRTSGAQIAQLEGHSNAVIQGELIDDRIFVSLAWNRVAFVWDVAAARPLATFRDIDAIAVTEDRREVAFVSAAGVRIWSPRAPTPDLDALRGLRAR